MAVKEQLATLIRVADLEPAVGAGIL